MSKQRPKFYAPLGLNTTAAEHSSAPGVYPVAQNIRTSSGNSAVRTGMKRLVVIAPDDTAKIIDADGSNDKATTPYTPAEVFPLGTQWTVEFLCQADTLSGDHYIIGDTGASSALKIKQTSSNTFVATVTDSAVTSTSVTSGATATVGTVCAVMLTRNGATLSLYVNNAAAVTATMSATNPLLGPHSALSFYANNNANFYDGRIEFFRAFKTVKTTQADGWYRLANPLAPDVICDYVFEIDAGTGYVLDRSRFENHLTVAGTPATTSTLLGHAPVPVQSIAPMLSRDSGRRVILTARGLVYSGTY